MNNDQHFVLGPAGKSRGGHWANDDYDVRDSRGKVVGRQRQLGLWTEPSKTIASSDHGAVRFAPDEKITMRKYLLLVLAIIAGTIIAAETADMARP